MCSNNTALVTDSYFHYINLSEKSQYFRIIKFQRSRSMSTSRARHRSGSQLNLAIPTTERQETKREIIRKSYKYISFSPFSDCGLLWPWPHGCPELWRRRGEEAELQEHLRADQVRQGDQHPRRQVGQRGRRAIRTEGHRGKI